MVQVDLLKIDVRTPDLQGDQRTGEMRMRGRRSKANALGTLTQRSSNGWGSGEAPFEGGTQSRPKP